MMKRALTAATLLLLASTPAWAATPGWSVSERSGSVTILRGGISHIAMLDGAVASNDVVATGPNGRAVLVRGEEFLVVAPNSRLRVADPAQTSGFVQIIEEAGNVIYRIKRMTMQHFAVKTPYLAAVVKGTTFSVSVGPEGATVQVIEGAVEVATADGGARELIKPGMVAAVGARDLGRLKIDGDHPREIVSPTPPVAPAADTEVQVVPAAVEIIETPVAEPVQSVAALTGGLVEGSVGLQLASASIGIVRETRAASVTSAAYEGSPANPIVAETEDTAETTTKLPPTPLPAVDVVEAPTPATPAPDKAPVQVAIVDPLDQMSAPSTKPTTAPPSPVESVTAVALDPGAEMVTAQAEPPVAAASVTATAAAPTVAPSITATATAPVSTASTNTNTGTGPSSTFLAALRAIAARVAANQASNPNQNGSFGRNGR